VKFEAPLPDGLASELVGFWDEIFGEPHDLPIDAFLGAEAEHNRHVTYVARRTGDLAGTCHLAVSHRVPSLGGLGEVATAPQHRAAGIATELCGLALDDFRDLGGRTVFLGTGNDAAARIYRRLGWRKLADANVMANTTTDESPEEFLADHYRAPAPVKVDVATPSDRIPMIPLLVTPHDSPVLDANASMYSTRYSVQRSCMGLYRRYDAIRNGGRGERFSAVADDGHVVGISSARLDEDGGCQVDGFSHARHSGAWPDLLNAAMAWAAGRGAAPVWADVPVEDEEKRAAFESLGFRPTGPGAAFDLDGVSLESIRLMI